MCFGHGNWGWMLGGGLMMILFWGGLVALGVLALRAWPGSAARQEARPALEALNARYARGEISKAEYDEIRGDLQR